MPDHGIRAPPGLAAVRADLVEVMEVAARGFFDNHAALGHARVAVVPFGMALAPRPFFGRGASRHTKGARKVGQRLLVHRRSGLRCRRGERALNGLASAGRRCTLLFLVLLGLLGRLRAISKEAPRNIGMGICAQACSVRGAQTRAPEGDVVHPDRHGVDAWGKF